MKFAAHLLLGTALLAAGCSHVSDRVVLLPQADGRPSAVEVIKGKQRALLSQPYAAVVVSQDAITPMAANAQLVKEQYGAVLAGQPARPQRFVVRFEANGNRLTPESDQMLQAMRAALARLPAAEVVVTGHTDRVGSLEANDKLSVLRAETVRDLLVASGVPRAAIQVAGRGEREPEQPTADEVAEPRNRRVEIKIR